MQLTCSDSCLPLRKKPSRQPMTTASTDRMSSPFCLQTFFTRPHTSSRATAILLHHLLLLLLVLVLSATSQTPLGGKTTRPSPPLVFPFSFFSFFFFFYSLFSHIVPKAATATLGETAGCVCSRWGEGQRGRLIRVNSGIERDKTRKFKDSKKKRKKKWDLVNRGGWGEK